MRCRVRWATRASHLVGPGPMLGDARGRLWRRTCNATLPLCSLGTGSSSVLHARRPGARGRANALISVIETGSGSGCHTPPTASALGRPWSARSRACTTPTPLSPRQPPARPPPATAAVALDGYDQGRQGSPSSCRYWAARLADALTRSRPRRSLRCWPGLPPTLPLLRQDRPLPSTRPSGRARRRRPGRDRRHRTRWVLPAPARRGRAGAGARRPPSRTLYAPPAGRAAWRVAGSGRTPRQRFGSRRWGW
jgi:hypothetical protein